MDRPDWGDAAHSLQRNLDPVYQRDDARVRAPRSFYSQGAHGGDSDGEPLENDVLSRKRNMLQDLEERISRKRAPVAVMKTERNEEEAPSLGGTSAALRDRVTTILLQRHSPDFLLKCRTFKSPTERETPVRSKERVPVEEHHLLKLRVKALMRHRHDPSESPSNSPVPAHTAFTPPVVPSPPRQSATSPDQEESVANKGFERFLSLLNKGVDIDLLKRIVNDDSEDFRLEDMPFIVDPCGVKGCVAIPISSESLTGSEVLPPVQTERSPSSSDDDNRKDRQERNRSRSPPELHNKKDKEKEKKAKVDERCEQLQNILSSLGLSLEAEEMSKLTDRTQERLYGRPVARGVVEQHSPVASSGLCKTSRKSSSRSWSRSPSGGNPTGRHKESFLECGDSALSNVCDQDEAGAHLTGNNEAETHQSGDTLPQYTPCNRDMTYWAHAQGAALSYLSSSPHSVDPYHFHTTVVDPRLSYHAHHALEEVFMMNPDLSLSECQFGSSSGLPRFLQPVAKQLVPKPLPKIFKWAEKRNRKKKNADRKQAEREKWLRLIEEQGRDVSSLRAPKARTNIIEIKRTSEPPKTAEPSPGQKHAEVELSKEGKQQLTEEEIKANLRKKLEAFNQKNKAHTKPKS